MIIAIKDPVFLKLLPVRSGEGKKKKRETASTFDIKPLRKPIIMDCSVGQH